MTDQLLSFIERFKLPLALTFLGLVLIIGGTVASGIKKDQTHNGQNFPKESLVKAEKTISIDVSGAVNNPGVYQLKDGDRIEEAIKLAGGFSENSNGEYISKYINMAQKLVDGSKVYIPMVGEEMPKNGGAVAGSSAQGQVNINTSSQSELEALPGIGPVSASKIISDRPYQSIDELLSKKIVSKATFEKIKDLIVIY
jgi:competence protein ComEA